MKNLLLLSIIFSLQDLSAQSPGPQNQPIFSVEYRIMSWEGGIWDLFHRPVAPGDEPEYFTIPSYMPSAWFRHRGPLPIPIYKKGEMQPVPVEIAGQEGVEVPRPVAFLNPGKSGKFLFFLLRDRNDEGKLIYRNVFIEDQTRQYDEGYLFINLSPSTLAIEMNGEVIQVAPEGRRHMIPPPGKDYTINFKIAENDQGTWKMANTSTLRAPKLKCVTTVILTKVGEKVWMRKFADAPREVLQNGGK